MCFLGGKMNVKSIKSKNANIVIEKLADKLKRLNSIKKPEWADFVKTGSFKERSPVNKDWWFIRSAAILRSVTMLGPIGVSKLRKKYGGKKNRGMKPEKFYLASGSIIRKVLQQLELEELIKKKEEGIHKGRLITKKGLDLIKESME